MKLNKNENGKKTTRRQTAKRILAVTITVMCLLPMLAVCVFATDGTEDALAPLTAFQELMASIVTLIGGVLALWGVVQVGMSLQSHDPSQRSQGLLCLAGGILIAFAPTILRSIGINI